MSKDETEEEEDYSKYDNYHTIDGLIDYMENTFPRFSLIRAEVKYEEFVFNVEIHDNTDQNIITVTMKFPQFPLYTLNEQALAVGKPAKYGFNQSESILTFAYLTPWDYIKRGWENIVKHKITEWQETLKELEKLQEKIKKVQDETEAKIRESVKEILDIDEDVEPIQ